MKTNWCLFYGLIVSIIEKKIIVNKFIFKFGSFKFGTMKKDKEASFIQ